MSILPNGFSDDFYENQTFRGLKLDHGVVKGITFSECTFSNCVFSEAALHACKFQGCTFRKCDLSLAQVDGSSFTNTQFKNCKLVGINWVKAAWGRREFHTLLKTVDFSGCALNYGSFAGLNLEKISLRGCTAWEVDFSEANLSGADCAFTDFNGSQFRRTDLSGADLRGALNYAIHPGLNTLKKTRFSLPEAMSLLYCLDIVIEDAEDGEGKTSATENKELS